MDLTGKLFAQSLKGKYIGKTSDGWEILLSNKSPRLGLVDSGAGYFKDEDIFILTDYINLISYLQNFFQEELIFLNSPF